MPSYNLRILLESVEGKKTSYITKGASYGSFISTGTEGFVLSASTAYDRITGSISCSFQNEPKFTGTNDTSKLFVQNTLLSASLTGSLDTGSILFTSLDTDYDRLLRYKFFGQKVCNTLGLPNDQWIYVDQVRFSADDESNIFQGNANLGNTVITDTLTFAGGSDVNSDISFLIDTGSDRYVKFVDERGVAEVALRMGYDVDGDVYEVSGSDDKIFNIGGVDNAIITSITSSNLHIVRNTDGGNTTIKVTNSNTDTGTDKGAGIEFRHMDNTGAIRPAGSIIAGKDSGYNASVGGDAQIDSNLKFSTTNNGVGGERIRITSDGKVGIGTSEPTEVLQVEGDISASGDIIGNRYIVNSTVSNITQSFSSGSTIFGDTIDDTHKFTGSLDISGSIANIETGKITASGHIVSLDEFLLRDGDLSGDRLVRLYADSDDGVIDIHANDSAVRTHLHGNDHSYFIGSVSFGSTLDSGEAITIQGGLSASGDIGISSSVINTAGVSGSGTISGFTSASIASGSFDGISIGNASPPPGHPLVVEGNISSSGTGSFAELTLSGLSNQGTEKTAVVINGSNVVGRRELGNDAFTSDSLQAASAPTDTFFVISDDGRNVVDSVMNQVSNKIGIGNATPPEKLTVEGNISSSGTINALSMSGDGSGLTGITAEWDGTLNGDAEITGSLVISGAGDTKLNVLGNITASGNISVGSIIDHNGDDDTKITFTDDDMNITVGDVNMIDLTHDDSSQDEITFNEGSADLDFRVEGNGDANLLFTDAGNDKIGIGTNSPTKKLTIEGAISASQNIFIGSGGGSDEVKLIHSGDEDTHLLFDANKVNLVAGGSSAIKLDTSTNKITINNTNSNLDTQIMGDNGEVILHTDAGLNSVGINTIVPITGSTAGLTVEGGISASGDIQISSSVINTAGISGSGTISGFTSASIASGSFDGISIGNPSPPLGQELVVEGNISSSGTGSFGKMTIGTTDMFNTKTQLTVNGGDGGVAMAVFERTIGGTGRVNINANSSEPQIQFRADNDSERMNIGVERAGGAFVISSGSALADRELMVVKQSGEVGIGTTSPATKLDVKGDISASGDIQISSSVINTAGISGSGTISGFTSASIASGSFAGISIGNASPPPGQELVVEGNISASVTGSFSVIEVGGGHFTSASLAAGGGGSSDVVDDTSPQLGGDLDLNSNDITGTGNIAIVGNISGSITSTGSFAKLDVFDINGGNNPRLRVGRADGQHLEIDVDDNDNKIHVKQDSDSNGEHNFILNRTFDGTGANNFKIQKAGTDQLVIDVSGSITASGEISASGKLIAKGANFNDEDITNVSTITLDAIEDDASGGDTKIEINGTTMNIDVGGSTILETTSTSVSFDTNITASGNISMSSNAFSKLGSAVAINEKAVGELTSSIAPLFVAGDDGISLRGTGGTVHTQIRRETGTGGVKLIRVSNTTGEDVGGEYLSIPYSNAGGTGIMAYDGAFSAGNHITASGNISASGNLDITGRANIDGDIDISGSVITPAGISGSGAVSGFTSASIASGSFDGISIGNASPPPGHPLVVEGNVSASGDSHRFGDLSTNGATIEVRGDSSGADLTKLGKINLFGQGDQRLHLRSMGDGGFTTTQTGKSALVASQYDLGLAYNWNEGGASSQGSELRIYNSESIAITVTSQSRVGIGTGATVGEALEVVGNISASITSTGSFGSVVVSDRVQGNLTVDGTLFATKKSFLINKPKGGKLEYGVLEGPQHDVFFRGELKGDNVIYLPQEWDWLVDENTITTQLTSIGKHQDLFVKEIKDNKIFIDINGVFKTKQDIHCYHIVHGTRKDVERIENLE